jgi:hypothetical protein
LFELEGIEPTTGFSPSPALQGRAGEGSLFVKIESSLPASVSKIKSKL